MPQSEAPRHCLECDKPIKGRVDKKFCDDYCRNAYNNRQNSDQNNFVRKVNNTLRRNRRLLEGIIREGEEIGKCPRQRLLDAGYDFHFQTHSYTNRKGNTYTFCYEYGYLPLEGDWLLVVKRGSRSPDGAKAEAPANQVD